MGDVMGPLSYPPWREGETLPPSTPPQLLTLGYPLMV